MSNANKKDLKLEILLATMQRTSLDFLAELFPENNFQDYNILIVNQTSEDRLLHSEYDNIRIINSFEKGLSRSRNLALKEATGDICLIADDDVRYTKNFDKDILSAFHKKGVADVITFKMQDFSHQDFKAYQDHKNHDFKTIRTVNSVVIAFKLEKIIEKGLNFNNHFGLGAQFSTGEEYIFLHDALSSNLVLCFEPKVILLHDFNSSGRDQVSDQIIYSRAALFYNISGGLGYLKLCRYLYLVNKRGFIDKKNIFKKFKVGLKGISDYRTLTNTKTET